MLHVGLGVLFLDQSTISPMSITCQLIGHSLHYVKILSFAQPLLYRPWHAPWHHHGKVISRRIRPGPSRRASSCPWHPGIPRASRQRARRGLTRNPPSSKRLLGFHQNGEILQRYFRDLRWFWQILPVQQILTDSDMLWYFERGFVIHEFVPNESKWWKWWKATLQLNSCYPLCFPSVLSFSLVLFQPRNIWIICHGGEVLQQGILQSVCRQNCQQKKGGRLCRKCSKCSRLGLILYISVLSLQLAQARRFSSISFWISSGAFSQSSSYSSNGSMDESGKRVTGSNQSGCSSSNIACHATISYNFPMP